ncbi:MAG: HAD-IIA family hydrolase [Eubacteriales bacterium]
MTNSPENLQRLKNTTLFVLDMDGTVYLGEQPFPDAVDLVNDINKSASKRAVFFTNNPSKDKRQYEDKLSRLGFDVYPGMLHSSADSTARWLSRNRTGKSVYVLGTLSLSRTLEDAGVTVREDGGSSSRPDIVLSSFDLTLTWDRLEQACRYIREGAEWLCTHPDVTCPSERGPVPDAGSINALIHAVTGCPLPRVFGKPDIVTAELLSDAYGADKGSMAVFGDRLYTDVALGKRHGILSGLVLTGETTLEQAKSAPAGDCPDLVFERLSEIGEYVL